MHTEEDKLLHKLNRLLNLGIKKFSLIEDGDSILIGLSGGKDSLTLLELLSRKQRILRPKIQVFAVHVRSSYINYQTDISFLSSFCEERSVPFYLIDMDLGEGDTQKGRTPCFLCSWMRRKEMFNLAQKLGCNKIALGHHCDDIIQTALMNLSFNGRFDTMAVRQRMHKFPVEIIRPLCCIREKDIQQWTKMKEYTPLVKLCPYETVSNRTLIKTVFNQMESMSPDFPSNMFSALNKEGKLVQL